MKRYLTLGLVLGTIGYFAVACTSTITIQKSTGGNSENVDEAPSVEVDSSALYLGDYVKKDKDKSKTKFN